MAPLSPILETVERAMSRGYEALPIPTICATSCSHTDVDIHIIRPNDEIPIESVFVPSATIKRLVIMHILVSFTNCSYSVSSLNLKVLEWTAMGFLLL